MPVIQCDEVTIPPAANPDAVWVPNGAANQLFYYNVDSCLTVTLVCANGLVGGHVGQFTPAGVNAPAANVQAVIAHMIVAAPVATSGALREIFWIGSPNSAAWDLAGAVALIWAQYGGTDAIYGQYTDQSPVDIVFDTATGLRHVAAHQNLQTAAGVVLLGGGNAY